MNLKRFSISVAINLVVFVGMTTPLYPQDKSLSMLANDYSLALKIFGTQKNRKSLETLLRKGTAAGERLDQLELLSESEYTEFTKKMRGFEINRDEIVFINPDARFFRKLAVQRGTKADGAFFNLMLEIKPDNVWPVYIEQQTDVTGCTIYGNGSLTKLYGKTLEFKTNYPKAYTSYIDEEMKRILEAFTENVCACGDRNSVVKEFRLFIRAYPKNRNTPAIEKRLTEIEKSKDFRFNCQSG